MLSVDNEVFRSEKITIKKTSLNEKKKKLINYLKKN